MRNKVRVKFHRLRNGFFPKAVKRLVLYLLGNGATLDDKVKTKIDKKFDNTVILAAINACIDGVVWGFAGLDKLIIFRATEFIPLVVERTNITKAGIRFWQIEPDKPTYVELYEVDGITEYEAGKNDSSVQETASKRPYKKTVRKDAFTTTVIDSENYGVLPIFPLYANELKTSELTTGLQALIDAYDFVSSDWVDNTTLIEGLYGIIKNFGGQDAATLLAEIQQLKVIVQDDDSGAELNAIEMPFQSRQNLLDFLERRMYDDFLLPDSSNDGRAVTATEIKAAREDMDIKADLLEWQVAEFVENVLRLKGLEDTLPSYKRRTTTNDTETVSNISTMISDEYMDAEGAIQLNPLIPQEMKEDLLKRIELRDTGAPADEDDTDGGG